RKTDYNIDRLQIIRRFIPSHGKLLEIGAWDGTTIRYYKEKFKGETYGIDVSEKVLEQAAPYFTHVKEVDLNCGFIPFENEFFDVIVCGEVIEHTFDTDQLLSEIHRILKNNGTLIISTPNLTSFANRIFLLFGLQPLCTEVSCRSGCYGNPFRKRTIIPAGHIRNFTYKAFVDIVTANGFTIEQKKSATISTNRWIGLIEKITGSMHVSLGCDIILKCTKNLTKKV
ncbi:MAG TPA: class I SAM-dependent methyltransferase, partial [Chitinispirillaceae bacterium]|nr:class I SAM-dependent methyltransferase [Chitinispirillaceae bacterium]